MPAAGLCLEHVEYFSDWVDDPDPEGPIGWRRKWEEVDAVLD